MEPLKETRFEEEITFPEKANILTFLISPVKQFVRMREEVAVSGAVLLILGIVLLGLIFPAFIGQGGLFEPKEAPAEDNLGMDMYSMGGMGMGFDEFGGQGGADKANPEAENLLLGLGLGVLILAAFAGGPALLSLLFLLVAKIGERPVTYYQLYAMTVFSTLVLAVGFFHFMIMNTVNATYSYVYAAPSVFVDADSNWYSLLATLNVFAIVFAVLIAIGLVKVAHMRKIVAILVAFGCLVGYFLVNHLGGALV
ncbi:YIP1 family protein [Shouchella lonarensis]|uniref:Yip1 domain-containing protein n=1 Tax=Shouchella lonarensis TaxID=1464122 RepID=A0A1G6K5C8_9BACI|nr:YIP1 family protein [Shouchella lonarensis]SDC26164.1 Yip1 domain-containing protein [Shouchella lonarensis]